MGLACGTNQHWYIREHERKVEKGVVVINKKAAVNKKRTVEATEQAWKIWDETLEGLPCKASFMTIAMERFISDIQAGKVEVKFDFMSLKGFVVGSLLPIARGKEYLIE